MEGKFSLEYAVATALLDDYPGFASFSDEGVRRPVATALRRAVRVEPTQDAGTDLLTGSCHVEVEDANGTVTATVTTPPGAPARPPTDAHLDAKVAVCLEGSDVSDTELTWKRAAGVLRRVLP